MSLLFLPSLFWLTDPSYHEALPLGPFVAFCDSGSLIERGTNDIQLDAWQTYRSAHVLGTLKTFHRNSVFRQTGLAHPSEYAAHWHIQLEQLRSATMNCMPTPETDHTATLEIFNIAGFGSLVNLERPSIGPELS
jgi:hypothetical protein